MAELLAFSQSSLFLLPKHRLQSPPAYYLSPPSAALSHLSGTKSMLSPTFCLQKRLASYRIRASAASDSKMLAGGNYVDLSPETGDGDFGGADGNNGGRGRGGDSGNSNSGDNGNSGESDEPSSLYTLDEIGMILLFQMVTFGYSVLIGVRGVNDYLRSGNRKSLVYDVGSTVLLVLVHMFLPAQKKISSLVGIAVSFPKFIEMTTRFEKSGKINPDALFSAIDFLMVSWYLQGFSG